MIPVVIIVIDEGFDLLSQVSRQKVILQQNAILQGLMPAFNLSLSLRVIRRATDMGHAFVAEPFGQVR